MSPESSGANVYMPRPVTIEPFDLHLFGQGEHWDIYRILGAHPATDNGDAGYRFAVWAPNARDVHVAGDFNSWQYGEFPLHPVGSSGIWAGFIPGIKRGALYKYGIRAKNGVVTYKSDPYALFSELRPGTASVAWDLDNYTWTDDEWLRKRANTDHLAAPMSIYEVHVGSWQRRHEDGHPFLSWPEITPRMLTHIKNLGFTHIELMPVAEHPLDESWGYQTGLYYAPSSRYGTPEQFKAFVDACHNAGIGVLLDWVPAHFPKDAWGLGRFDGTALYEHEDPRRGEHPDWGTYVFNYGRHEVRNFLLANALYWLKEFHIDGLRMDAVASMLYLDYSRKHGEWVPNAHGGREDMDAVAFLRDLNSVVHGQFPGAITVAEESTAWPGVSRPVYTGGLGFTFKWNMGWMHDMLDYMSLDSIYRSYNHNALTFSLLYAFNENFVLPFSHDEVVHGKGALLSKMPGDIWQKQANLRLLYAYQWAHPGKKLLFMGSEFGQWNEWSEAGELDWVLYEFPGHNAFTTLLHDLNHLYTSQPAMHAHDHDWTGFSWLDFSDFGSSVISFERKSEGSPSVVWVFNFTPVVRHEYSIPLPHGGEWQEVLNTDSHFYTGSNVGNPGIRQAAIRTGGFYTKITLPPLAAMAFMPAGNNE